MPRPLQRFAYVALLLATFTSLSWIYREDLREIPDRWHGPFLNPEPASSLHSPADVFRHKPLGEHPIDNLIENAEEEAKTLLKEQTGNAAAAASAYRARRGRHPPPGFEEWFHYAASEDCMIVEEFFDQIHRDIEPFWGMPASDIRKAAASLPNAIHVRGGKVVETSSKWSFVQAYIDMLGRIEAHLPDVDLPINEMDEPRILVPWEKITKLMDKSIVSQNLNQPPSVNSFPSLPSEPESSGQYEWLHEGPYWNIARQGCNPQSPARDTDLDSDFSKPPQFPSGWPVESYKGFVSNWTKATDPCLHAHLRNLHGSFVEPISQSTSTDLLPMFGGSKMPFNNDILLPGAVYWNQDDRFISNEAKVPWSAKRTEAIWRGSASGGRNTEHNWTRFQRHRLLSMLNGTQVEMAMQGLIRSHTTDEKHPPGAKDALPYNFPLPDQGIYPLESWAQGVLPDWIRSISNAAFTWLVCFPATETYGCSYTGSWYRRGIEMPLYRMFKAKYLPDVDGNSFSGRYLAFLRSNSVPIKATIYKEWHDDRLVPWKHFVPIDNTFIDLWAVLEYLVSRDRAAETIAVDGRLWVERVLRKEDMLVYAYRLILEYARVSSDDRDQMGWYGDEEAGM